MWLGSSTRYIYLHGPENKQKYILSGSWSIKAFGAPDGSELFLEIERDLKMLHVRWKTRARITAWHEGLSCSLPFYPVQESCIKMEVGRSVLQALSECWILRILSSHKKGWDLAICSNMDRLREYRIKWSKSDWERRKPWFHSRYSK